MPTVKFTSALRRFFPSLQTSKVEASSVAQLISKLEHSHPGLSAYLVDERGALRKHVNIFVGQEMVTDKERLSDKLAESDEVYILQSLSGG